MPKEKINDFYLEQISGNGMEKFGDLKQLIMANKLPVIDDKINLLELGVGGGETMRELKEQFPSKGNLNIIGLDRASLFAEHFCEKTDSYAIVADAGLLPIKDDSLSAVNASAILHEVSSYGVSNSNEGKAFGVDAIRQTFNEINRCLADKGVFVYRDIACPKDRLEMKSVSYDRKSWQMFLDLYLPILCDVSSDICPEILDSFKQDKSGERNEIFATAQVQREIQRHYITFRDFFRKKIFPKVGIKIIKERWEDKVSGNKIHSIELTGQALAEYLRIKNLDSQYPNTKKIYLEMYSDEYDDFTDNIIEIFISEDNFNIHDEWFRREGREIYTYLSIDELKKLAEIKYISPKGTSSSMEAFDEKLLPRDYYQRYLNRVMINPEYEGKQIINFIKKTYEK